MPLSKKELKRLEELSFFEKQVRSKGWALIAGVDEAGRGPLAGPVVAAACVLPEGFLLEGIDDSKKLDPEQRRKLYECLIADERVDFGIGIVEAFLIDQLNIFRATLQAMTVAITKLKNKPSYLLVDGPHLPDAKIPGEGIIGGDGLSISIAAASILAKETRDQMMRDYDLLWPHYGFAQHKGYGTPKHLAALEIYGPCDIHRKSFEPVRGCLHA